MVVVHNYQSFLEMTAKDTRSDMAKIKEDNKSEINDAYLEGVVDGYARILHCIDQVMERREINEASTEILQFLNEIITAEIDYAESMKDSNGL